MSGVVCDELCGGSEDERVGGRGGGCGGCVRKPETEVQDYGEGCLDKLSRFLSDPNGETSAV